jgi:hypothetical protein
MELTEMIGIAAGVLAVVIAFLAYQRSGQPMTVTGITETLERAQPLAEQIREVAEVAVEAAQQLKESGKINTGSEAFAEAMSHLQAWFPEVEPSRLVPFVEAAYRGVKLGLEVMKAQRARGGVGFDPKLPL